MGVTDRAAPIGERIEVALTVERGVAVQEAGGLVLP